MSKRKLKRLHFTDRCWREFINKIICIYFWWAKFKSSSKNVLGLCVFSSFNSLLDMTRTAPRGTPDFKVLCWFPVSPEKTTTLESTLANSISAKRYIIKWKLFWFHYDSSVMPEGIFPVLWSDAGYITSSFVVGAASPFRHCSWETIAASWKPTILQISYSG